MQLGLAVVSLATAMAALSASTHQNAVHQPMAWSMQEFVKQKSIQQRKAFFGLTEDAPLSQSKRMHKASLTAFSSHLAQRAKLAQPGAPIIPHLSAANVTKPTELPPPPPTLNPYTDMQPFDTLMGNTIASSFLAGPTITPPPTQEALDLAYGCTPLEDFPANLKIMIPRCVKAEWEWDKAKLNPDRQGGWSKSGEVAPAQPANSEQKPTGNWPLNYTEVCNIFQAVLPYVDYKLANGEKLGSSRTRFSFFGNTMELLDCSDNIRYTIEEKIYHATSHTNEEICKKYKSCEGTVFLQYFVHDRTGKVIAETAFLNLFQDEYTITQPGSGLLIATVKREAVWSPWTECPEYDRYWDIEYNKAAPGIFALPQNRWPIAMMVTMVALRDTDRSHTGMVWPSTCETVNVLVFAFLILFLIFASLFLTWIFYRFFYAKAVLFFYNIEVTFFPHTIYKPSKYEG